jgi:hypothetical protein
VDYDEFRAAKTVLPTEDIRETASFLGLINKVDYTFRFGGLMVQPRWKSEFQRNVPALKSSEFERPTTELRESGFLIVSYPIMPRTRAQGGLEYLFTKQYRDEAKETLEGSPRSELVGAMQITNRTPYQGYEVYTQMGLRVSRIDIDIQADAQTETFFFFTVYAGFGG